MVDKEKRNARQNKWASEHQDRIYLNVPKGLKAQWQQRASEENLTLTEYIIKKMSQG